MKSTMSKIYVIRPPCMIKILLLVVFVSAGTLSIKAAFDLSKHSSVMKTNYAIAWIGFAACAVLACFYLFGQFKFPAVFGLMLVALVMLLPNDNCANPFNHWWIDTIGASPLMYVPNIYTALFVTCGLSGIHTKSAGFLTMGICIASLMLGPGHQLGIIW